MTEQQQQALSNLFRKYGRESKESFDIRIPLYGMHPDNIDKCDDIIRTDKRAKDDIATLERYIDELKAYRVALSDRYNQIVTAPTTPVIELKREKNSYTNKVLYYIRHYNRDLNTNKDVLISWQCFKGTERKQAIEEYSVYVASHPGIIAIKSIEKASWE